MTMAEPRPARIPWPPLIYLAALVVGILLGMLYPAPWLRDFSGDYLLGSILFGIGWLLLFAVAALWVSGVRTLIKAKTPVNPNAAPEHLVTGGAFAVSRNPIYLGNTLLLIGVGLIAGNLWMIALAFAAAFTTGRLAIAKEEKLLAAKFGKRYRDYAKRVRRWI